MGSLDGRVVFVTGAARGQGRSHAVTLAAEGADVIAIDLCSQIDTVEYDMSTPDDLETTVREVEALGRRIHAVHADVRDPEAVVSALEGACQDFCVCGWSEVGVDAVWIGCRQLGEGLLPVGGHLAFDEAA
ncbi:KR domain-containing protein [Dietzia sp. oral taxon 368]|nr:KR domain-containing protein [Dietzia sp. oral taxon 368]